MTQAPPNLVSSANLISMLFTHARTPSLAGLEHRATWQPALTLSALSAMGTWLPPTQPLGFIFLVGPGVGGCSSFVHLQECLYPALLCVFTGLGMVGSHEKYFTLEATLVWNCGCSSQHPLGVRS